MKDSSEPATKKIIAIAIVITLSLAMAFPLFDALNSLGFFTARSYLVVLQSNKEIRSTGGFMSVICELQVEAGSIKNLQFYDVEKPPINVTVKVNGPDSVIEAFNTSYWKFRDINNDYNFLTFAAFIEPTFQNLTGHKVDGTIAVDLTAIEEIVRITGPITAFNETITHRNVIDRMMYYAHDYYNREEFTRFLYTMSNQIIAIIKASSIGVKFELLQRFTQLAQEKHVLLHLEGSSLMKNYEGAITKASGDFLYIVDSNTGAHKADFSVDRTVSCEVNILTNGSTISTLTVTYTNNCFWNYTVFTTALVPEGAILLRSNAPWLAGALVTHYERLVAFSSLVRVPANSTLNLTYVYTAPNIVHSSGLGSHYDLYIQKQPGINQYLLNLDVKTPSGTKIIRSENVGNNLKIKEDVAINVIYT